MSVLLKDVKIPAGKLGTYPVLIHTDGTVEHAFFREKIGTAVNIPPHGRLVEERKVLDIISAWCPDDDGSVGKAGDLREMLDEIEALPTIIPAEEAET